MKKYLPELQKIITDISEAEEKDRQADEEYFEFGRRVSVDDWKEDEYQELLKKKECAAAAYMAKLLELKYYVGFILNQEKEGATEKNAKSKTIHREQQNS